MTAKHLSPVSPKNDPPGNYEGLGVLPHVRNREPSINAMVNQAQIDSFLILDDAYQEFSVLVGNLVVCNPLLGVSDPEVQAKVRDWLNKTAPQNTISAGVH